MIPFVIKTDLDAVKHVADSIKNAATWPQFVIEAQRFDIKHWIGDALLNEIDEQLSASPPSLSVANTALMDGGSYVYQSQTYLFGGLKLCIIYYAFARFVNRNPYNFTAAGITVKDTDFSTPASDKAIQRIVTEATLMAASLKDEVVLFLRRNSSLYPLYKCHRSNGQPRTFFVIGD
jgi:hypothetical protein